MNAESIRFTKHEGAGNDFLVVVDPEGRVELTGAEIRWFCDRRRGVGADGVIRVRHGDGSADLTMTLWNPDGGQAEMSGNGIRALAQAALGAGMVRPGPEGTASFTVATAGGTRTLWYHPDSQSGVATARVEMGLVRFEDAGTPDYPALEAQRVDVGNPHLVLLVEDPSAVDLAADGAKLEVSRPGGQNVEFIAVTGRNHLVLRVWERGAGATLACGTGSVAAAAAARRWGLVSDVQGDEVVVDNPGGRLSVWLGRDDEPAVLGGPVRRVAEVVVDRAALP